MSETVVNFGNFGGINIKKPDLRSRILLNSRKEVRQGRTLCRFCREIMIFIKVDKLTQEVLHVRQTVKVMDLSVVVSARLAD